MSKLNPRRVLYESKGDTIVSLMYAAAAGDLDNLRRYVVHILHGFLVNTLIF